MVLDGDLGDDLGDDLADDLADDLDDLDDDLDDDLGDDLDNLCRDLPNCVKILLRPPVVLSSWWVVGWGVRALNARRFMECSW